MLKGTVVKKEEEYPCLKQDPDSGRVVLFTGPYTGMCLVKGSKGDAGPGNYDTCWAEQGFKRISGPVTVEEI